MRVALLTSSTEPRGGVGPTLALAGALARAGAEVTVWTLGGADAAAPRPVDPGVRVRLVPFADRPGEDVGARTLRAVAALGSAFAAAGEDHDVVHAQDALSARAVPGCVRTVRTPGPGRGAEPADARALVVPVGVDAARFAAAGAPGGSAARGRWRARLGRYVLALGGVEPRGGTLDLVEAMATVALVRPDLTLVVAGGSPSDDGRARRAVLDARAEELEVYPLVLGPVPDHEVPGLVAAADVVVPASDAAGFGPAALEALAAGVPVVAPDLPVLREVLGDTVRFAAGPARLAAGLLAAGTPDPSRAAAGRVLAAGHSWDAVARAVLRAYRTPAAAAVRHSVGA